MSVGGTSKSFPVSSTVYGLVGKNQIVTLVDKDATNSVYDDAETAVTPAISNGVALSTKSATFSIDKDTKVITFGGAEYVITADTQIFTVNGSDFGGLCNIFL